MVAQGNQDKKTWMVSLVSTVFILGIFAVACLFLVNIGVQVYRNVVVANQDNFELRTSLSYVATKVRQADKAGCVQIKQVDGVDILVLTEEDGDEQYETNIYYYEGWLYEHFMEKGDWFEPGYGMETFEIDAFSMEETENGVLCFTARNRSGDIEELTLVLHSR